jgi:hypothetical protein
MMNTQPSERAGESPVGAFPAYRRLVPVTLLAVAALFAACEDVAPQFEIDGTGSVEGFLYFDADEDRVFDPSDGDSGLSDIGVSALVRSTDDVLASTTTGSDGRFAIPGVAPGTIELLFDDSSVPEGVFICQNPVQTTVFIGEPAYTEVAARPACLVDILDVQETGQAGDFVIVEGIVTAFPGMFDEGDGAIQDETGGIWLFDGTLEGAGLEVGDLVELGGTVSLAVESLQLTGVEIREIVKGVGALTPEETTTGAIAAASDPRDPLQNRLVTVRAAELTTDFSSGGDRNANLDDGSGSTIIRVESGISDSGSAILTTLGMTVGNCYDVTGIVGAFFGDGEIFPRSVADVVEVPCG